jgi:hypothetical protein
MKRLALALGAASGTLWACSSTPTTMNMEVPADMALPPADLAMPAPVPDLATRPCVLGSQWQLVDSFLNEAGGRASARAIVRDAAGSLWVSGNAATATGTGLWVLRRSSDEGRSFQTVFSGEYATGRPLGSAYLAVTAAGRIFLSGWVSDAAAIEHWLVRRSTNAGMSFTAVDDFQYVMNKYSASYGVAEGPGGALFVAGYGFEQNDTRHWLVRRSVNGGDSWSTVDDLVFAGGTRSEARFVFGGTGAILATGLANDGTAHRWLVRRSSDGTSFSQADDFRLAAGRDAVPNWAVSSGRTHYVSGNAVDAAGLSHWIVRRSADDGATWTTVDDLMPQAGQAASVSSLGLDKDGNVYALGSIGPTGSGRWAVRRSTNGGTTWQGFDDWGGLTDEGAGASGLAQDASGSLYVIGSSREGMAGSRWVVRKLACQ